MSCMPNRRIHPSKNTALEALHALRELRNAPSLLKYRRSARVSFKPLLGLASKSIEEAEKS